MNALNELQRVELEILSEFARIAKRENLRWFAMFGTLLGAVRQRGFIPWDDDIDIALPRVDYDRLRKSPEWFKEPYFLQTTQNDPAAASRFVRLRRSDTAVIKDFPNGFTRGGNLGACIDILPLDDVPNANSAKRLQIAAAQIRAQLYATAALDENEGGLLPDWKAESCYSQGGIAGCYPMLAERYEWLCSRYSKQPFYAMPVLSGERGWRVFEKAWFSEITGIEFEGLTLPAPSGWKEVLIASYPEGTREPEKDSRKPSHYVNATVVDMNRPYKKYVSRYTDMLENVENDRVFIFGAGDSLRIWLERYSQGVQVVCALDNDMAKWGSYAYGVPIRPPGDLPALLNEGSRLIIASLYHKEISEQLRNMGIMDFYIFIDGLNYGKRTAAL